MFGKVIVFGLLKMIQKKKMSEDRDTGPFGLQVRSGKATRAVPMCLFFL